MPPKKSMKPAIWESKVASLRSPNPKLIVFILPLLLLLLPPVKICAWNLELFGNLWMGWLLKLGWAYRDCRHTLVEPATSLQASFLPGLTSFLLPHRIYLREGVLRLALSWFFRRALEAFCIGVWFWVSSVFCHFDVAVFSLHQFWIEVQCLFIYYYFTSIYLYFQSIFCFFSVFSIRLILMFWWVEVKIMCPCTCLTHISPICPCLTLF